MSTAILGIGTALPSHRVTQQEATKLAIDVCCRNEEQAALVQPMYRRSEIVTRYMDVFVNRDGKWLCVGSQSTKVTAK